MKAKYRKNAGAVFSLKFHLVWCPKYRRSVLTDNVATRLKALLEQKSIELGFIIHAMEIMPDHVHMFIETDPCWCVAGIANALKGHTSHTLRMEFPHLKSRLPTLWSRSYYAASIGGTTEAAIKQYIEQQKGR